MSQGQVSARRRTIERQQEKKSVWMRVDGKDPLKKGDILRTPVDERNLEGRWLYGVCSGEGFGCATFTRGNAIFMSIETESLEPCLKYVLNPDDPVEGELTPLPIPGILLRNARWERFWHIERLVR